MWTMLTTKSANVIDTLRKVAIFADLSEAELQFLAERAVPRDYASGELVFSEGQPCAGLFIVESGALRIFKSSPSGREQVLSFCRRSGQFGCGTAGV
jgi:CRP/FNR family transcriptional regulator, dissimilatory nitrate respiration regulator